MAISNKEIVKQVCRQGFLVGDNYILLLIFLELIIYSVSIIRFQLDSKQKTCYDLYS